VHRIVSLLVSLLAAGPAPLAAETLYSTDFDSFPTGNNAWAGFDGWLSNDTASGAQGIDDGLFSGALGKTAALGFNRPDNSFTSVAHFINYDPAVGGNPLLEFQTLFGIEDSTEFTNFRRDDFFFSFYNMEGDLLAAIRISNADADYGFWRQNGSLHAGGTETDTGQEFIQGELHNLNARIDLGANRWTATLDGVPLFEDEIFNGTGVARTLGPVAAEWLVALGNPVGYGDNWMLVADLKVETVENPPPPLRIDSLQRDSLGEVTLRWKAGAGYSYSVEYSHDLQNWFTDLPNSTLPNPLYERGQEYTDPSGSSLFQRYYRLRRTSAAVAP